MNNILVTVVIPTYKRSQFICRAVESALHQTIKQVEVIVVDDNGKGTQEAVETENQLKLYIDQKRITYICNDKNSGGSFSRNQGLNIAQGKYVTFLDDDDEIHQEKLEKQILLLEKLGEEYSCCYTGYHKLLESGMILRSGEKISGDVYKYALSRSIYVGSGSNILARTELAKKINGYDIRFKRNQDLEFLARILKGFKLAYLDEDLMTIHYEIRENKYSYEQLVGIDSFFLEVFQNEIHQLHPKDCKGIYDTFALERFRYSVSKKKISDGIKNLYIQRVSLKTMIRYFFYVIHRLIGKLSYGFKYDK